jgi:hypothetical protein
LCCLSFCSFSFDHCVVCPFVLFLLTIVLFVLLLYLFGIFKHFLTFSRNPHYKHLGELNIFYIRLKKWNNSNIGKYTKICIWAKT